MSINSKELKDKCYLLNNIVDNSLKVVDALVLLPDNPRYILYLLDSLVEAGILKYNKSKVQYEVKDTNKYYNFIEKYCNSVSNK